MLSLRHGWLMVCGSRSLFGVGVSVFLLLAVIQATAARAQSLTDGEQYQTTRGLAMGLGARASAATTSALQYNVANLALGRQYHIESAVGYDVNQSRLSIGGAVADSSSGPFALGFAYRYLVGTGRPGGYAGWEGKLGLAIPMGESFSIGVAGRYLNYWRDGQQPEGATGAVAEGITMDAALRATLFSGFHIAAIGQNLIDPGTPMVPRLVGGSVSWSFENTFTLAFDGFANVSTYRNAMNAIRPEPILSGSGELFISGIALRAGYIFDGGRNAQTLSAGVGYVDPRYAIDFSWRGNVVGQEGHWLMASIRYFVR